MKQSDRLRKGYLLGLLLWSGTLLAEGGSGMINPYSSEPPPPGGVQPFSAEEQRQRWSCYITVAAATRQRHESCQQMIREDGCRQKVDCLWRASQCSGAGYLKCREVLHSQCTEVIVVAELPTEAVASKRYHCDPDAAGRIIFSPPRN